MARRWLATAMLVLLLPTCGGDGNEEAGSGAQGGVSPTTAALGGDPSCPQRPLSVTGDERWTVLNAEATGGTGVTGAVWQSTFTFTNANAADVSVTFPTVMLDILGPDGHHRANGKTTPREQQGTVRAGGTFETVSQVIVASGNIPKTLSLYAATTARAANGSPCTVPIQGASPPRPPAELQNVKDCEPQIATVAC